MTTLPCVAQEMPWYKPDVRFQALSTSWVVSDRHFDNDGRKQDNLVQYGYYSTAYSFESNWGKRLFTSLCIPFLNYVYTELPPSTQKNAEWKFGDIDLGINYSIVENENFNLTGTLLFGIPIRAHEFIALKAGDNEFNQLLKLEGLRKLNIGNSMGNVILYAGYNHRALGYAEEIHFGASGSVLISNGKIKLGLYLDGIESPGSGENGSFINPTSLFSNFKEYLRLSTQISYFFSEKWGITFGTGIHLSGRNFVYEPMYSLGIIKQELRFRQMERMLK